MEYNERACEPSWGIRVELLLSQSAASQIKKMRKKCDEKKTKRSITLLFFIWGKGEQVKCLALDYIA